MQQLFSYDLRLFYKKRKVLYKVSSHKEKMAQSHILSAVEPDGSCGNGSRTRDPSEGDLQVHLDDRELWTRFRSLTNEMIVTKNGR